MEMEILQLIYHNKNDILCQHKRFRRSMNPVKSHVLVPAWLHLWEAQWPSGTERASWSEGRGFEPR